MIAIICAMSEERDAFLSLMKNVKKSRTKKMLYHGKDIDNLCYIGKIKDKDVVIVHSGVGKVYAALVTSEVIRKYKPELVINVGCAGSLNENVHKGDIVVGTRVADWDVDVPGWQRGIDSIYSSFECDKEFVKHIKSNKHVKKGHIVSADEFIYQKNQLKTIKKFFPTALCGEMEGSSVANTCYAYGVKCAIIRSISDETLINGDYKDFDFNLNNACQNAAKLCIDAIMEY